MGAFLSSLTGGGAAAAEYSDSADNSGVTAFHSSARWQLHLNSLKEDPRLAVIDFSATWCGPCRMMEPVLQSLANEYTDVHFSKIDVDELPDVAKEFQVQAMPTFVLLKRGNVVATVVGAKKDELVNKIKEHRKQA